MYILLFGCKDRTKTNISQINLANNAKNTIFAPKIKQK